MMYWLIVWATVYGANGHPSTAAIQAEFVGLEACEKALQTSLRTMNGGVSRDYERKATGFCASKR